MSNKSVSKANLKFALQQNNEKIKEYINNRVNQSGSQISYLHPNMFSLEERIVGCWINGKPLYEKTFLTKVPKVSSQVALNFYNLNIENIIDFTSTFANEQIINSCPINSDDNYLTFWYNKTAKLLHIACTEESWVGWDLHITVQYTKSTDEENSFTDDMIVDYIPLMQDYTKDEVVNAIKAIW